MKRVLAVGTILVTLLVLALALRIRAQRDAVEGPPGGAGVIEGTVVDVGARISARIERVSVRDGQAVSAGDVLAELDCREPRARLAEAEARIASARAQALAAAAQVTTAARSRGAAAAAVRAAEAQVAATTAQGSSAAREAERVASLGRYAAPQALDIATSQAETVEHQIEAARAQSRASRAQASVAGAQVESAAAQARAAESSVAALEALRDVAALAVEECTVRAPRTGVVEDVYYEAGELLAPGAVLARIVELDEVRATFYLPNAELAEAWTGRGATVVADAWPEEQFEGEVITVAAEAEFTPRNIQTRTDRDRLVYPIEVRLANPERRLRPGMPVQVTLTGERAR